MQNDQRIYEAFIQQYVVKAIDWLQKKSIEISKIGHICNILKYTNGVQRKEEFCVRLIYCLGFALESEHQNEIATKVRFIYIIHVYILQHRKHIFSIHNTCCIHLFI